MRRILLISHSPTLNTGYGRVTRSLARDFNDAGYSVAVGGLGFHGEAHNFPYPILGSAPELTPEFLARAMGDTKPDLLLTIGDPWMFHFLPWVPERHACVWLAYFPVDGYPLPAIWRKWIKTVDI